jgi:hypothetical protein
MKYHHRVSLHRRRKYLKGVYIFAIFIGIIAALIFFAIRLDSYLQSRANTFDTTTSEETSAYFASSNQVFTTQYFQFQTPKNWAEIPTESTGTKFVYRGINKPIIEDELIIYVNNIPGDLTATRLLPVKLAAGGQELSADSVSDHCNEVSADHNIDEKVVKFKGVSINCDIDNTQFNVLVGLVGGTTRMTLNRPDGSTADYTILYRNVKAIPDASGLLQIMQSFQTR